MERLDDEDRCPARQSWTDPRANTPFNRKCVNRAGSDARTNGGRRSYSTVGKARLALKHSLAVPWRALVVIDDRDRIELISWWPRGCCAAMP